MSDLHTAPRIIRFAATHRQRWRNGGGWTREIARDGDGDNWHWRLSVADVESNGPFSAFPGVEREIVLLSGAGMMLDVAGGETVTLAADSPRWRFAGERAVTARLIDGPTRDFNLMWQRQALDAALWLRPMVGAVSLFAAAGETWVLHMQSGRAALLDMPGTALESGDTLIIPALPQRQRQRLEAHGSGIVIRLRALVGNG